MALNDWINKQRNEKESFEDFGNRGRGGIDSPNRKNFSKRTMAGTLDVVRLKCSCGHHKAFRKVSGTYCTKCKKQH